MSVKYDRRKILLIAISVAVLGIFAIGSQFVQQSLAQEIGQDVERNETVNQSAGLGDPSKLYVPSQPVD
jgi:hypothetical protein